MDSDITNEQRIFSKFNYNLALTDKNNLLRPKVDIGDAKLKTLSQDTVEISKKKGLSKKAKILIGLAGLAAAIGIGFLVKKQIDAKKVVRLAEHIDFKEASTLEEAVEFGKKNLGIHKYKGFKPDDLDAINWINEGLVNVNNATKGTATMPKKIIYKMLGQNAYGTVGGIMNAEGTLQVSKNYIQDVKEGVTKLINSLSSGSNSAQKAQEFINELNSKNNFKNWHNAWFTMLNKTPKISAQLPSHTSTFSIISHEMGHLQHCVNTNSNLYDLSKNFEELFNKSKDIALKVSKYATESPTEFVAECYAKMIDGIKLDADVMDLYQKLGGVMI